MRPGSTRLVSPSLRRTTSQRSWSPIVASRFSHSSARQPSDGICAPSWHRAHCALEHGGIAPAIVDETADIDAAIPGPRGAASITQGRSACRFSESTSNAASWNHSLKSSWRPQSAPNWRPLAPRPTSGRSSRRARVDRVDAWVHEALTHEQPARLIHGGRKLSATTYEPTVLLDPSDDARLQRRDLRPPSFRSIRTTHSTKPSQRPMNRCLLSGLHLHARPQRGTRCVTTPPRNGRDGQRPYRLSRGLDALRRTSPIGPRRRRHRSCHARNDARTHGRFSLASPVNVGARSRSPFDVTARLGFCVPRWGGLREVRQCRTQVSLRCLASHCRADYRQLSQYQRGRSQAYAVIGCGHPPAFRRRDIGTCTPRLFTSSTMRAGLSSGYAVASFALMPKQPPAGDIILPKTRKFARDVHHVGQ